MTTASNPTKYVQFAAWAAIDNLFWMRPSQKEGHRSIFLLFLHQLSAQEDLNIAHTIHSSMGAMRKLSAFSLTNFTIGPHHAAVYQKVQPHTNYLLLWRCKYKSVPEKNIDFVLIQPTLKYTVKAMNQVVSINQVVPTYLLWISPTLRESHWWLAIHTMERKSCNQYRYQDH